MKVLITLYHRFDLWNGPPWLMERLRADFPHVEFAQLTSYDELEREIADADAFIGWSLRPQQLVAARNLKWIHSPAAAVHQLLFPELVESDIVITNARDVHGAVVAEHAMALLLALAKRLPSAVRHQQRRQWGQQAMWKESPPPREVQGATLAVIGLGSIGREVARRASALGMRVIAVREHPGKGGAQAHEVHAPEDLDNVLAESDFVLLAAPLTEKTRHLINAARLQRMKPDAYLINVSRGPLIDDQALVAALKQRRIAGAALDVFVEEPLPPDSPYWELENVLITPHTAAVTEKLWERHYALIRANLERFFAAQPLLGVVDKKRGY